MGELQPYQILQALVLSQPNKIHFCRTWDSEDATIHQYYTFDDMGVVINYLQNMSNYYPTTFKILDREDIKFNLRIIQTCSGLYAGSCDLLFANTDQANLFEGYEYRVGGEKYLEAKESLSK